MCILEFLQSKFSSKISEIDWICCFWYLEINIKKSSSEMMILRCWIILSPWNCNPSWFGAHHPHLVTIRTARELKNQPENEPFWKVNHLNQTFIFGFKMLFFRGVSIYLKFQSQIFGIWTKHRRLQVPPPAQAARRAWHVAALGFPSKTPCRFASGPD